ncbi:unnamed protein product [Notodromas monacha]|uniref:ECSIT C-terminal domain-containing protein n=1 Tax=Notodromas monacha TaxID=399045 RepID=A0A7R9GLY1_9CRUS|nr:unnamed protein product [Notodromas monacha]CAG0925501.1 unnamed protein product [Notodromas monacha]
MDISHVSVAFKREKDLLPVKALTPSVHEQADGVILAACATGTSSRDSLLSWIRLLQRTNPRLGEVPVVFKSRSPVGAVIAMDDPEGRKRLEDGKEGEEEDDRPRINAVNFNPAFTPSS